MGKLTKKPGQGVVVLILAVATAGSLPGAAVAGNEQLSAELATLSGQIGVLSGQVTRSQAQVAKLTAEIDRQRAGARDYSEALSSQIRAAYVYGITDLSMAAVMSSSNPIEAASGATLMQEATRNSAAEAGSAVKAAVAMLSRRADLKGAISAKQSQVAALEVRAGQIRALLGLDGPDNARLALTESASGRLPERAPGVHGGRACPVGSNHHFTDTYGAARSGGRHHEGVDLMAPYGSPVYAYESGVITKVGYNTLGGNAIWERGNSGTSYYYAHQSSNLVRTGQRVVAGQVIGRVGKTGDARFTVPHVHFEVHPGGGGSVNPTPYARRVC